MSKPWDQYRGDELNVNGLKRGPEYLPILHRALDWFERMRDEHIKQKLRVGGTFFMEVYPMIRKYESDDVRTYYEMLQPSLKILHEGNYIYWAKPKEDPVTVPLVSLSETAFNHLNNDKEFRENLRDRLMFYLYCGAKIG